MLLKTGRGIIREIKSPDEWTDQELKNKHQELADACSACALFMHAREFGSNRRAAAENFERALYALYSSSRAAALIRMALTGSG